MRVCVLCMCRNNLCPYPLFLLLFCLPSLAPSVFDAEEGEEQGRKNSFLDEYPTADDDADEAPKLLPLLAQCMCLCWNKREGGRSLPFILGAERECDNIFEPDVLLTKVYKEKTEKLLKNKQKRESLPLLSALA